MKKIIYFLIIGLTLSSCMEVLDIDLDEKDKLLVVNSLISSDTTIRVNITKTISSLDGDAFIKFINDAEVKLYENDEFVETLLQDTLGYYFSTIKPDLNKKYTIVAEHKNYPKLTASCSLPDTVSIKDVDISLNIDTVNETWIDPYTGNEIDTTFYQFTGDGSASVYFDDPADETNYYMVTFTYIRPNYIWDDEGNIYITGYYEYPIHNDVEMASDNLEYFILNSTTSGYIFSDALFNGTEFNFKASISTWEIYDMFYDEFHEPIIYAHLYSLDKEVYKFVASYNKYKASLGNPFAEPVNIYTNIENGLGIFGSFNKNSFTIPLTDNIE